jgi:hypothetical protein
MGFSIFLQPSLRLHLTDLVNVVRQLHLETDHFLKERAALYVSVPPFLQSIGMEFHFRFKILQNLRPNQEKKLASSLSHVVCELRKCTDINGLVHFITSEEVGSHSSSPTPSSSSSSTPPSPAPANKSKVPKPIRPCWP